MLHSTLENQIKFIREEIKDDMLSTIERAQLKTKLEKLIVQFNTLVQKANQANWHLY